MHMGDLQHNVINVVLIDSFFKKSIECRRMIRTVVSQTSLPMAAVRRRVKTPAFDRMRRPVRIHSAGGQQHCGALDIASVCNVPG